jgi:hypothetical protein
MDSKVRLEYLTATLNLIGTSCRLRDDLLRQDVEESYRDIFTRVDEQISC